MFQCSYKSNLFVSPFISLLNSNTHPFSYYSSSNSQSTYDVAIVGGGAIGACLSLSLARSTPSKNLRLLLVDPAPSKSSSSSSSSSFPSSFESFLSIPLPFEPDPRVYACSRSTVSLFKKLGIWEHMERLRVTPVNTMQVWDYGSEEAKKLFGGSLTWSKKEKESPLSHIIEDQVIQDALYVALTQEKLKREKEGNSKLDILYKTKLVSINQNPISTQQDQMISFSLSDGTERKAKLLVGADGINSTVRNLLKISTTGWSHEQQAVVCSVLLSSANSTAWQRFTPYGTIALLPLHDLYSSIVWSVPPSLGTHLMSTTTDEFASILDSSLQYVPSNEFPLFPNFSSLKSYSPSSTSSTTSPTSFYDSPEFSSQTNKDSTNNSSHPMSNLLNFFGSITNNMIDNEFSVPEIPPKIQSIVGKRLSFPLHSAYAHNYTSQRVALVGDSAHRVHPFAGQGMNLGFLDVVSLSNNIFDSLQVGRDIGTLNSLEGYEKERNVQTKSTIYFLNLLNNLFRNESNIVYLLRNMGFTTVNHIKPLKDFFQDMAAGKNDLRRIGDNMKE